MPDSTKVWVQWALGIAILAVLTFAGYSSGRIDRIQASLETEYVKVREFSRLCSQLDNLNNKMDKMMDSLSEHERRTEQRGKK